MSPWIDDEDIVSQVLVHFSDCKEDRYSANTLTILARTCKALSNPALNLLWRDVTTLLPLICTAPPDLWRVTSQPWKDFAYVTKRFLMDEHKLSETKVVAFRRQPTASDLDRIRYYGAKIHSFDQEYDFSQNVVNGSVWAALATRFYPAHKLFPNLRSLCLFLDVPHTAAILPNLRIFLGPKTQAISLTLNPHWEGPERNWSHSSFATTVSSLAPNLEQLSLVLPLPSDCQPISELVRNLKHLSKIECSPKALTQKAIKHLVRSRALVGWENLELSDFTPNKDEFWASFMMSGMPGFTMPKKSLIFDMNLFDSRDGHFPSLRKLGLVAQTWDNAAEVLRRIDRPLEAVKVMQKDVMGDASDFPKYMGQLPRFKETLREIYLHGGVGYMTTSPQDIIVMFEPLTLLNNLESFYLSSPAASKLSDNFIINLCPSWPRLRFIHITIASFGFPAFAALARSCADIETIELDLQTGMTDPLRIGVLVPAKRVTHLPMFGIDFGVRKPQGQQAFQHVGQIFAVLITLFPNLRDVGVVDQRDIFKTAVARGLRGRYYGRTE